MDLAKGFVSSEGRSMLFIGCCVRAARALSRPGRRKETRARVTEVGNGVVSCFFVLFSGDNVETAN